MKKTIHNLNYGLIGNTCSAALISEKGSIDWLCMPYFDNPSVFAALLDKNKGGHFAIHAEDITATMQSYIPHTNLLRTRFETVSGIFEVTDYMPYYRKEDNGELYHPCEIYRYIHIISGSPRISFHYDPRSDYARGKCVMTELDGHVMSCSESNINERQYLYSSLPVSDVIAGKTFTLTDNQFFLLSYNEKLSPVSLDTEKLEYCRTLVYWLNWSEKTTKFKNNNDIIERSLLTLKMMQFYSGAVLAAITTSLPEIPGDVRNWDYRFCWLRDASMTIETQVRCGHSKAAHRFVRFINSTFMANHSRFQIMYGIHGERRLTETELPNLEGYLGSRPVRIGNKAYVQRQNDSYGYLMNMIYQYFTLLPSSEDERESIWDMIKSIELSVMHAWRKPDKGIWEIRGEAQHFVSSKVMCWVALDRGAKIARMFRQDEKAEEWRSEADKIHADVMRKGWNDDMQCFTQAYGSRWLDVSVLLMESYGFIDASDPRFKSTVDAIDKNLIHNGLAYRYNSPDDFGTMKSAFTICTFWLIRALFVTGRKARARKLFDGVLSHANHLGMFSEDISLEDGSLLGNFPPRLILISPLSIQQYCYHKEEF